MIFFYNQNKFYCFKLVSKENNDANTSNQYQSEIMMQTIFTLTIHVHVHCIMMYNVNACARIMTALTSFSVNSNCPMLRRSWKTARGLYLASVKTCSLRALHLLFCSAPESITMPRNCIFSPFKNIWQLLKQTQTLNCSWIIFFQMKIYFALFWKILISRFFFWIIDFSLNHEEITHWVRVLNCAASAIAGLHYCLSAHSSSWEYCPKQIPPSALLPLGTSPEEPSTSASLWHTSQTSKTKYFCRQQKPGIL